MSIVRDPDQSIVLDQEPGASLQRNDQSVVQASVATRLWARITRRPRRWFNAPWTNQRLAQYITALVLVGLSTVAVAKVVHLTLVFQNNTPTGGDFGAHVMAPAYLRDHLLPHFQLSGWTNNWYAGTPLYRYYMVVPALVVVLLNTVLPYGVALKVTSVLGILTLPFVCWCFGRLARFRYPMPELMALAGMIFLFDESFSIYGGNIKSTMAGEFSFSISLSLAILGLGLFARGLETGKYRCWTAIVLSLAMLSHGVVLIFVALGMVLLWLIWMDRTRLWYGFTMGFGVFLLTAFWVLPFVLNHAYMTDMKYEARPNASNDSFWYMFFPWPTVFDVIVTAFAAAGFAASVARRQLNGAWLGICCLALMAMVFITRNSLPVIGLLWNPRLLPFLYLLRLMLMMVGIVEVADLAARGIRGVRGYSDGARLAVGISTAAVVTLIVLVVELFVFQEMPGGRFATKNGKQVYTWGIAGFDPVTLSSHKKDADADGWTRYNFDGYEGRPYYGEYKAVVDTMADIGRNPDYGCGRAMWENNDDPGLYGTTMALMLLPHWTDGCITSMEGLFFEASGTTPYHFVTSAAMSSEGSKPVRKLRYDDTDASKGVPYLQTLGVNYLMVFTEAAIAQANGNADLTLIDSAGPWRIYAVAHSDLVEGLTVQPVVVNGRPGDPRERNLEMGMSWFQHRQDWAAIPADDGPANWQRINLDPALDMREYEANGSLRHVDVVRPRETINPVALAPVTVTNVDLQDQSLSFSVDQIGVPVVVKLSYFPNWQIKGAEGPYRIAPNLMVVVPTSTNVSMTFEQSNLDRLAYLLTLLGIVYLVVLRRRGDVHHATAHPFVTTSVAADSFDSFDYSNIGHADDGAPAEAADVDRRSAAEIELDRELGLEYPYQPDHKSDITAPMDRPDDEPFQLPSS